MHPHKPCRRSSTAAAAFGLCAYALIASFVIQNQRAEAQTVWLAPKAPYPPAKIQGSPDLMDLFNSDAPWSVTAAHVRVLKLPTQFMEWVPDEQLAIIVANLRQRGIALAVESLSQSVANEPQCGQGVEGYGDPRQAEQIAGKIQRIGGTLSFVAMDEPLFYGHFFNGSTACHSSVDNVAERVAAVVSHYRSVFPGVVIGDIEPAGAPMLDGWDEAFTGWVKDFRIATKAPLGFLHVDVDWNNPNHVEGLKRSVALAKQNDLSVGVIYNGRDNDISDENWVSHAKINIVEVQRALCRDPNQVVFQSWVPYPSHLLPESDPQSLTGLIKSYLLSHRPQP